MTDPNLAPQPTVTTSDSIDDTAATTPAAAGTTSSTPSSATTGYQPDYAALQASKADPETWASHVADMIAHTTGTFIAPDTFTPWFAAFSDESRKAEARSIAFEIANLPIGETITGDPGSLLVDLRNEMSLRARKRSGI